MRHRSAKRTLNKPADQRKALVNNLLVALFREEGITTTLARAKALAEAADELVSNLQSKLKKEEEMNAIRTIKKVMNSEEASKNALQFAKSTNRTSGFTQVIKVGYRDGDGALMARVNLLTEEPANA